jgi:hypothetical protein
MNKRRALNKDKIIEASNRLGKKMKACSSVNISKNVQLLFGTQM